MNHISKEARIYIAGHKGLIGSAFHRYFEKNNYTNLIVADRKDLDLKNQNQTRSFFRDQKIDYVIFAAGKVGGIVENRDKPAEFIMENLSMQVNAFRYAAKYNVKKFIFFASSCVYPKYSDSPMSENIIGSAIPEQTSIGYSTAKYAGIQMSLALNKQSNKVIFIPVIPNSVYGPNDNFNPLSSHVIAALIRKFHEAKINKLPQVEIWGTGLPKREFVYVDDLVEGIIKILSTNLENDFLPINIAPQKDLSIKSLAELISRVIGYDGKIVNDTSKPDGSPRKILDNSRISSLGWKANVSLEKGILITYNWFLENQRFFITEPEKK